MSDWTAVHCLQAPKRVVWYSLPPRKAVFAAYQSEIKKQNNTWEYLSAMEKMPPMRTRHGWVIGDFWARDQALPDWLYQQGAE